MSVTAESRPVVGTVTLPDPWVCRINDLFAVLPPPADLPEPCSPRVLAGNLLYRYAVARAESLPMPGLAPAERAALVDALRAYVCARLDLWLTKVVVYEINLARDNQRLRGDTPQQRLDSFFEQLRDDQVAVDFCRRYPVLISRIARHFDLLIDYLGQVAAHLESDRERLRACFGELGPLLQAELGSGDAHFGARQVVILRFAQQRLVYKPRSLAVDAVFAGVLERVNPNLRHALRAPRHLAGAGYGWQEYITSAVADGVPAAQRFYYSMGAYIALAHLLNATDFHFENILTTAAGEPVLFDLETAFANSYAPGSAGVQRASFDAVQQQLDGLNRSVLRSSILPNYGKQSAGMNALTDLDERDTVVSVDTLVDAQSDQVRLERTLAKMAVRSCLPTIDGKRTRPVEFVAEIYAGFDAAYDFCLAQRVPLREWIGRHGDSRIRSVLRNTSMYGMFSMESTHPVYAASGERLQQLFAKLGIVTEFQPAFRAVLGDEVAQLMQFDIPAFTARLDEATLTGYTRGGLPFYGRSPLQTFDETLAALSPQDRQLQRHWVGRTLGLSSYPHGRGDGIDGYLQRAVDFLLQRAVHADSDDSVCWLQIMLPEEGGDALPLPPTLYAGDAGMLLLFAALAAHGDDARVHDTHRRLRRMVRTHALALVRDRRETGVYQGAAGPLYALLQDARLHADAAQLDFVREQTYALLAGPAARGNDVIGGAAGVMLFLCSLLQSGDDTVLEQALAGLGEQLLAARDAGADSWSSDHGQSLGGFSHGSSGIAHALFCAGERLGRSDFIDAARAAIAAEDRRFDAQQSNWPDVRTQTAAVFNDSWCNGAPGYFIVRAVHYRHLDAAARHCFAQALQRFIAHPAFTDESLCHGTAGGLDVLVTVRLHRPELVGEEAVGQLLQQLLDSAPARSGSRDCDAPALMAGLAGMAYAALRTRHRDLPSVLALVG